MKLDTPKIGIQFSSQKAGDKKDVDLRVFGTFEGNVTPESLWAYSIDYQDYPETHED